MYQDFYSKIKFLSFQKKIRQLSFNEYSVNGFKFRIALDFDEAYLDSYLREKNLPVYAVIFSIVDRMLNDLIPNWDDIPQTEKMKLMNEAKKKQDNVLALF